MQAPRAGSPAQQRRGARIWLWLGLVWCALATAGALLQPPGPVTSMVAVTRADRGLWDWWRYPVERHAFLRLPTVKGPFSTIAVDASGQQGWLAGDDGAVVATDDGGTSWTPRSIRTDRRLTQLEASADGGRLWAGGGATVFASSDGGSRWEALDLDGDRGADLIRLASDGRHGWRASQGYQSKLTRDGGVTWQDMSGVSGSSLRDLRFDDSGRKGLAIGRGGGVYTSEDGGNSWSVHSAAPPPPAPPVQGNVQTVPIQSQAQLPTSLALQGGDSWVLAALTPDGQRAVLLSEQGRVSWSEDSRKTWSVPAPGGLGMATDWTFSRDGRQGIAVGESSWLATSADGGRTWQMQTRSECRRLVSVRFLGDAQAVWAWETTDA